MKAPLFLCVAVLLAATSFADDKKAPAQPAPASSASAPVVKDVTPQEAEDLLKSKTDVLVLDVRTSDEFKDGHIKGAQNVDAMSDDFAAKVGELDKNKTYLLHCASGGRSSRVLKKMRELDFKSIYHMKGGISAWEEAGMPIEK